MKIHVQKWNGLKIIDAKPLYSIGNYNYSNILTVNLEILHISIDNCPEA